MPNETQHFDLLVIGGGPAGATLAGRCAADGTSVLLVDDGRRKHPVPVETMLPAAMRALERVGIDTTIRELTEARRIERFAIWGSDEPRQQDVDEPGFQVVRGAFERGLRTWATAQGATVLEGHRVIGPLGGSTDPTVSIAGPDGWIAVQARCLAVAAGRRTSARLAGAVPVETLPDTAALGIVGPRPDGDLTSVEVIEALPTGWSWWMPLDANRVSLTAFVDAERLREQGARDAMRTLLSSSQGPAKSFMDLRPTHASRATSKRFESSAHLLLVGDAASTIDPLSSQGSEKAIASGDQAAAAVRTMLESPELTDLALEAHHNWERGLWRGHRQASEGYYAQEQRFATESFWVDRSGSRERPRPPRPTRLQAAPGLERREMMQRAGPRLIPITGFAYGTEDEHPIDRVGPIACEPILDAFAEACTPEQGLQRCATDPRIYVQPPRSVKEAIATLFERGLLIDPDRPACGRASR